MIEELVEMAILDDRTRQKLQERLAQSLGGALELAGREVA
jgi:hypothetical protein